ncbi:MAG: signal peptidase I [Saprospiraceae bacterium]|nr:signal peptidase I [Saprospiraceae bacterium]
MSGLAGAFSLFFLFLLGLIVFMIVCMWRLYEKAGQEGWASIIPIYSTIIQLRIIEKPWWWLLLMMIPYLGLIWHIWALNLFVKKFGKSEGWTVGCLFLPFIFFPMMAFSDDVQFIGYSYDTDNWNTENQDVLDQI